MVRRMPSIESKAPHLRASSSLKMTASKPEPWKHHFVPRSLLKYFRPPGDEDFIYVFDKQKGRGFSTSLMNAASQNGFNTLEEDGVVVNFEGDFDDVDALLANRLREIHETKNLSMLSKEQRRDWADLVAVQLLRTPIVRSTMKTVVEDLMEQVVDKFGAELDMPVPTKNDVLRTARSIFADRAEARRSLMAKDFVLFIAPDDTPLRISDRPVTLESALPYGDSGLASHGVTVFMPLGTGLLLGLLCPSIGRKLNKVPIEELGLSDENYAWFEALREGLATGSVVQLDETMVKRHNEQQIAGCQRFVYGPTDRFADVQRLLSAHPEAREVNSSLVLGKIGQGPEPRPHMPMGSWLVLFGRSESHMLEVLDAFDDEPLEVTLLSSGALAEALKDGPFTEMQYYVDRHCRRGMRDVRLVRLEDEGRCRVQVRHANPGLDALMSEVRTTRL